MLLSRGVYSPVTTFSSAVLRYQRRQLAKRRDASRGSIRCGDVVGFGTKTPSFNSGNSTVVRLSFDGLPPAMTSAEGHPYSGWRVRSSETEFWEVADRKGRRPEHVAGVIKAMRAILTPMHARQGRAP
jgi:hypothetical protein